MVRVLPLQDIGLSKDFIGEVIEVSLLFSVAAGALAAAVGVLLGAFMLDVFLVILRRAVGPPDSVMRALPYPKGPLKRGAAASIAIRVFLNNTISRRHTRRLTSNKGIGHVPSN